MNFNINSLVLEIMYLFIRNIHVILYKYWLYERVIWEIVTLGKPMSTEAKARLTLVFEGSLFQTNPSQLNICVCFFICLGFIVPLKKLSLMWRRHLCRWRLKILIYARHSWPLSSEGSLACHTYCDTGHPFIMVISEDQRHSPFSSEAVTFCFYDWSPSRLGFEHPTFRFWGQRSNPLYFVLRIFKRSNDAGQNLWWTVCAGIIRSRYFFRVSPVVKRYHPLPSSITC